MIVLQPPVPRRLVGDAQPRYANRACCDAATLDMLLGRSRLSCVCGLCAVCLFPRMHSDCLEPTQVVVQ